MRLQSESKLGFNRSVLYTRRGLWKDISLNIFFFRQESWIRWPNIRGPSNVLSMKIKNQGVSYILFYASNGGPSFSQKLQFGFWIWWSNIRDPRAYFKSPYLYLSDIRILNKFASRSSSEWRSLESSSRRYTFKGKVEGKSWIQL